MFAAITPYLLPPSLPLTKRLRHRPQVRCQDGLHRVADFEGNAAVEGFGDGAGDAGLGVAVAAQGDGVADGVFIGAGIEEGDDALGVVVGDLRGQPGLLQDRCFGGKGEPDGTHAHGGAVAPAVAGARVFGVEPPEKGSAVTRMGVLPADPPDGLDIGGS